MCGQIPSMAQAVGVCENRQTPRIGRSQRKQPLTGGSGEVTGHLMVRRAYQQKLLSIVKKYIIRWFTAYVKRDP